MKIRAAVLEQTGGPHHIQELDLAPPGPNEVLVRLHATGVCHSDYNAIDGTAETRCPAVLGHEGAGIDAIQLEFGGDYRTKAKLDKVASDLTEALQVFAKEYLPATPRNHK